MRIFLLLNLFVYVLLGHAQDYTPTYRDGKYLIFGMKQEIPESFFLEIDRADSLFKLAKYKLAASTYLKTFKAHPFAASICVTQQYRAARALACAGALDSAFAILGPLVKNGGYYDYIQLSSDTSLKRIQSDPRWQPFLKIVQVEYQNRWVKYRALIKEADSLFRSKKFVKSATVYSRAFRTDPKQAVMFLSHAMARYNAVRAWSVTGYIDSAFALLTPLINFGFYFDSKKISSDTALLILHSDPRWKPLIKKAVSWENEQQSGRNQYLVARLDTMLHDDQVCRLMLDSMEKKFGKNSEEVKELWKKMITNDSVNQIKLSAIFKQYGWPGQKVVGFDGSLALFLVFQHADLDFQLKYISLAREALKTGNASPEQLAYIEDRIAVRQGKKQIYGTQLYTDEKTGKYALDPIEDEINVNKRRKAIGLGPIEEYVKQFGLEYIPPK